MSVIISVIQNVCAALTVGDFTYIHISQPCPEKEDEIQSITNHDGLQVKVLTHTLHLGITWRPCINLLGLRRIPYPICRG